MLNAPAMGMSTRRQAAPPAGYIRVPRFSVSRMKATTTSADHRADDQREHQKDGVLVVVQAEALPTRDLHQRITTARGI